MPPNYQGRSLALTITPFLKGSVVRLLGPGHPPNQQGSLGAGPQLKRGPSPPPSQGKRVGRDTIPPIIFQKQGRGQITLPVQAGTHICISFQTQKFLLHLRIGVWVGVEGSRVRGLSQETEREATAALSLPSQARTSLWLLGSSLVPLLF